jgi:hypothetical protein
MAVANTSAKHIHRCPGESQTVENASFKDSDSLDGTYEPSENPEAEIGNISKERRLWR